MKKVLIFDLGAASGRALICSYENKSFCSTEIHRFSYAYLNSGNTLCWSPDLILKEVDKAIDKAEDYGFDAVSIDAWGTDFALLDKNGKYLQRTADLPENHADSMMKTLYEIIPEKELYQQTGVKQAQNNTISQLLFLKKHDPKLFSSAKNLLMPSDLIVYELTGEIVNEYTSAATTGLIDPKTKNWNFELIGKLDLPKRLFGKIIMPGEQIGRLKAKYANNEIPVFACPSHDAVAAITAVPSTEKRFAYINCGKWALLGTELKNPLINDLSFESGFTNEGSLDGVAFLKKIPGTRFLQECIRYFNANGEVFTFNDIEAFARSAPPFIAKINPNDDAFAGANGDMPKKVLEYCEKTGQTRPKSIAQTLRVIYESLAAEFALTLEELEKVTDYTYPAVYIFGGGSKDGFLCQLTADAAGRTVIAGPTDASAIGNAMSVLITLGEIKDIAEARAIVKRGTQLKEYLPNLTDNDRR